MSGAWCGVLSRVRAGVRAQRAFRGLALNQTELSGLGLEGYGLCTGVPSRPNSCEVGQLKFSHVGNVAHRDVAMQANQATSARWCGVN